MGKERLSGNRAGGMEVARRQKGATVTEVRIIYLKGDRHSTGVEHRIQKGNQDEKSRGRQ